jgi:HEAT repeat protein
MRENLTALVEQLALRDWVKVAEAERALIAAGQPGIEAVIAGMTHPNSRIRRACAGFMDHNGGDFCVAPLTERLLADPVPTVRREAVHSLSCDRCKVSPLAMDTVPLLLKVAQSDPNPRVRREALFGLSQKAPDERVTAPLRAMLEAETNPKLRDALHVALKRHDPVYRQEHAAQMRARNAARRSPCSGSPEPGTPHG